MKKTKNIRRHLLLWVLMVNLVPCIKDGAVTWTTMEVGAQQYIVEGYRFVVTGIEPYTGYTEYLCVNVANPGDSFWSGYSGCAVSLPEASVTPDEDDEGNGYSSCYCTECAALLTRCGASCMFPTCPNFGSNNSDPGYPDSDPGGNPGGSTGGNPGSNPGYDPFVSPPIISVSLSCPNVVELLDPYNVTLTVNPNNATITSVKYLINDQYVLQNGTSLSCGERAKKAGYWTIKAVVNGTHTSNVVNVEVKYPDANAIRGNGVVSSNMAALWQETKHAASANGRSERACWIYVNTSSMTYECGETIVGPNTVGCNGTSASVDMGSPSEAVSFSPIIGGKYAVAFFHTHTPLTFCPSVSYRVVGPSPDDESYSYSNNIPGFVYDYSGTWSYLEYRVNGGHSINIPSQFYNFGPAM